MLNGNGLTFSKIILAIGTVDLRKGIDDLCSVIKYTYCKDPLEKDTLFLFCGTKRDRLKGVLWTGDRYVLLYIRLSEGSFRWPRSEAEARTINGEEFMRLMDGFDIDPSIGKKLKPEPIVARRKP